MPDFLHKALKLISYNRGVVIGLTLPLALFFLVSCGLFEGRVASSVTGEKSTADEIRVAGLRAVRDTESQMSTLILELEQLTAKRDALIELANEEIEAANLKTEENFALGNALLNTATSSPIIQAALGATGLGLVTSLVGALSDNRRKDRVVQKLKPGLGS